MFRLSPNIDLLYTEAGDDLADRVRAAADDGFSSVEMWGTVDRDVPALASALAESAVTMTSVLTMPRTNFTSPGVDLEAFYLGLEKTIADAVVLGSPRVVVGGGNGFSGMKRVPSHARLVEILTEAVRRTEGSGVGIVLEPVNSRVDHPGALLDHTLDAVEIVRAVASDRLTILFDLYHSIAQGEDLVSTLESAAGTIGYVQLADHPGRGEPGSGGIDWAATLGALRASGYMGSIGLEYLPTQATRESVAEIRRVNDLL